jgi:HEAT repeat protein
LAKDHSQSLSTTLPALEGITSRIPLDEATNALAKNLDLRSPAQWDGIFQALARSVSPVALPWLQQFAASPHGAMRRAAAAGLGAQKAGPVTQRLLEGLARDKDLPVRSEALWSLGLAGGESSVKILVENAQSPATEMAINATGALGRLAVRLQAQDVAQRELCPLIKAPHSYVRVNALVGLSLSRVRCGRGDVERDLVAHDPSPAVRRQAALLLQNTGLGADDSKTLDRCSRTESRPEVAEVCQGGPPLGTDEAPSQRKSATVFVYGPKGPLPEVHAPYTLRLGNGLLRVGHTDRRGAVFEAETPPGPLTLESPWALVP